MNLPYGPSFFSPRPSTLSLNGCIPSKLASTDHQLDSLNSVAFKTKDNGHFEDSGSDGVGFYPPHEISCPSAMFN